MQNKKWSQLNIFFLYCFLFFYPIITNADTHKEFWPSVNVTGALKNHPQILYVVNPQGRIALAPEALHQLFADIGIGYQYNPFVSYWLGYTQTTNRVTTITGMDKVNRVWEQLIYDAMQAPRFRMSFRTRLEEATQKTVEGLEVRLRQKIHLLFPIENFKYITPEIWNELFLNVTRHTWIQDNSVVDQNRFFVGILITPSPIFSFDIGYLDQYIVKNGGNANNNVFVFNVNIHVS